MLFLLEIQSTLKINIALELIKKAEKNKKLLIFFIFIFLIFCDEIEIS
jgi:hypothetical protein